eukprot:TRINITY_DN4668_c0_g1_i1.p1 TRINITY_DN4668_c0_g1~~TRINITY_DN4668_c0_g1_i1.p1  ORF type:complete len:422 (-),score=86.13 TRINITY_DN4668_c0_g1_i1:490-1755(-)
MAVASLRSSWCGALHRSSFRMHRTALRGSRTGWHRQSIRCLSAVADDNLSYAAKEEKPLVVTYKHGCYRFALDVNGAVAFSFAPETSLRSVLESVREESKGELHAGDITLSTADGTCLSLDTPIEDAVRAVEGVRIDVGRTQYPVVVARSTGLSDPQVEGHAELPSLLEKARMLELRARLDTDERRSMPFSQFAAICEDCDIPGDEADDVAAVLHKAGFVLHFALDPELKNTVYLKPDEVLEDLFSRYALHSPLLQHLSRRTTELESSAAAVEEVLKPLKSLQAALDDRAAVTANRYIWGLTSGILAGAGAYWYLVYVHFSWDIMEPVTFFTGLGVSTIGYTWWMATNKSYEYSNVYDWCLQRAKDQRYKQGGLDLNEYARLDGKLKRIRAELSDVAARKLQLEVMRNTAPPATVTDDVFY